MRHAGAALGSLALLIVLLITASAMHTTAQGGTPEERQLLTFDVQFRDTILAADASKLGLGDRIILSDRLLRNGAEVGHDSGVCTVTDVAGEAICNVVFVLQEGTIATQFVNTPPPHKLFAIIGGTGRFEGARGSGELVEAPDQTGTLAFHLSE